MTDKSQTALIPTTTREVPFYDDILPVALVGDIPYVAIRPITDFLGLEWGSQYNRIKRDEILNEEAKLVMMTGADGRQREMLSLPLDFLPGWLFGVTPSRVKPELAPKLTRYRRECFRVLWRAFQADVIQQTSAPTPSTALTQVRDLALAVAQMAEQQIEIQNQVTSVNTRVDRAAVVVGDLQRRLSAVERKVSPTAAISDAQATDISNQVKALGELLTKKDASKNHYQSIFAEIYRRFRVSSYKLIRQDQYQSVLSFLEDWQKSTEKGQERSQPSLFDKPEGEQEK